MALTMPNNMNATSRSAGRRANRRQAGSVAICGSMGGAMAAELEHEKAYIEEIKAAQSETARLKQKTAQMQRNNRWVFAAAAVVVLVSGGLVWVVLANNARQFADQSRQLQAQEASLEESRSQLAAS